MKLSLDQDLCTGHGRCYSVAPEVIEPDSEGYNRARGTTVEIASAHECSARRGVKSCPEGALSIVGAE
jgi:ferredoxin